MRRAATDEATAFTDLTTAVCLCPSSTSLGPCSCGLTTGSSSTVNVTCVSMELGDSGTAKILLSVPPTTPLDTLILSGNNLTKVPSVPSRRFKSISDMSRGASTSLLTPFTLLNYVDLSSNVITIIGTGDLALKAPVKFLNLARNVISSVAAASLPSEFHLNKIKSSIYH